MNKKEGTILILSLWILALLSLMASSLAFYSMLQMKVVRYRMNLTQGRYLAQAGVCSAMDVLVQEDQEAYEALTQKWATYPTAFKEVEFGDGKFSVFYTEPDLELGPQIHFGIIDEERKININTAPREIILKFPEATEELADAIVDWRDENDSPERRGAEKDYYQNLEIPYPPQNGPLERLEELLLVRGMTQDLFEKWRDLLTVYGEGRVNINTAPNLVLKSIGLDEDLVEKIIEFRKGPDKLSGTDDDGVFKEEGGIARTLFESEPLNSSDVSQLINLVAKGVLGVRSKHFTIQATGTPSRALHYGRKVIAVVEHVQADEINIRSWLEK